MTFGRVRLIEAALGRTPESPEDQLKLNTAARGRPGEARIELMERLNIALIVGKPLQ